MSDAEKDAAIRYLETAVAVRDQFIYGYQSQIFELNRKLKEARGE
jgi:hypothetical protein